MGLFNKPKDKHPALKALGLAILTASVKSGEFFKKDIDEKFGKDSKDATTYFMEVQYEFLFFFTHLTMRFVFGELGHEKRVELQNLLVPILMESSTEAWFGHWPNDLKEGIKKDFKNNINSAELEYSKYKKMFPEKDEGSKDTMFWEFGKNIARLSGHENDIVIITKCMAYAVEILKQIKLKDLVISAGKELE